MITNAEEIKRADLAYDRRQPLSLEQKYEILEALYWLAKDAGHFDPNDTSIDQEDIILATVLNADFSQLLAKSFSETLNRSLRTEFENIENTLKR
jgi:hypothetical protein